MNKTVLIGRVVNDKIEVRTTSKPSKVANFTLAVDRDYGNGVDFLRCTVWEKTAEFAEKYLKKGTKICVLGSVQTSKTTDKDGKNRYETYIDVQSIEFAGPKPEGNATEEDTATAASPAAAPEAEHEVAESNEWPF